MHAQGYNHATQVGAKCDHEMDTFIPGYVTTKASLTRQQQRTKEISRDRPNTITTEHDSRGSMKWSGLFEIAFVRFQVTWFQRDMHACLFSDSVRLDVGTLTTKFVYLPRSVAYLLAR